MDHELNSSRIWQGAKAPSVARAGAGAGAGFSIGSEEYLLADVGADMLALFPTQKLLALSMLSYVAGSTVSGLQRVDALPSRTSCRPTAESQACLTSHMNVADSQRSHTRGREELYRLS